MNSNGEVYNVLYSLSQAHLIQIGLIIIVAWLLVSLVKRFLPWLANRVTGRYRFYLMVSVPVFRLLAIIIALVLIVTRVLEPSFENMVALLGAMGLAIGFAFKDYTSSLIAGVVTLYEAPYRPGDWIEVNGTYGEVKAINIRSMEIVTPDDTVVHVPHLKLWDQLIFNANDGGPNLQCVADFYLHPRHDAGQVKHMLHDVALTSSFLQIEQPINVTVREKPWATHYRLKAYPIDPREQFNFVTDLTIRGKAVLLKAGLTFAATAAIPGKGE